MSFDFPDQPTLGTVFVPIPGAVYTYNGVGWDYKLYAMPQAEIISVDPDQARIGSPELFVRAEGGGFTANTEIVFDGNPVLTRLVSQTVVLFRVDPLGETVRTVPVTVQDGGIPGMGSVGFDFIQPLPIVIDDLVPEFAACGGTDITLTVMGNVFHTNCIIRLDGVDAPTDYIAYNELAIRMIASVELTPRTVMVTVTDTVNESNPIPFKYVITPIVTSIAPTTVSAAAGPTQMTITGSNFIPESEVVIYGVAYATTFVSSTQLTVTFSATPGITAQWPVFVRMGPVASNIIYFDVTP